MATALQSLSKLFNEKLFRIPDYQRGYAWGERQVSDFWTDLLNLEPEKHHYAGVITLEEAPPESWRTWTTDLWLIKSKGFTPYFVVDGQQRLTTAVILIQCFVESIKPISEKLNYNTAKEIAKRYIVDSPDSGVVNSYMFGYEEQNPSYEFMRQVIFREKINSRELDETAYTSNLKFAKEYFTQKVAGLGADQKQDLFKRLTQSVLFNVYEIESEIDTFVAFETMNNRGKPLSHLELLKNRLIYLTTRLSTYSKSETSGLRSQVNYCWKSIYRSLGRNKHKLMEDDRFLFTHSLLYFAEIFLKGREDAQDYGSLTKYARKDYQNKLLEGIFTQANLCQKGDDPAHRSAVLYPVDIVSIHKYVNNLKTSVELWFDIFNPMLSGFSDSEKLWLDRLNRINGATAAPLVLAFYEREPTVEARIQLLKTLERTIFFSQLWGPFFSNGDYFIHLALELVLGKITPERIIKQVESVVTTIARNGSTVNSLKEIVKRNGGFYDWPGVRYFLYEYEQHLRNQTKTDRSKIAWDDLVDPPSDHISVEHIYPQTPRDPSWIEAFGQYSPTEKARLRNSIGNLLPLSRPKNSSLQNKPFELKKSEREKFVGFAYGSLSENEVARSATWDAIAILERGIKLLSFAEERWDLDIGDTQKKIAALGLEFVVKPESRVTPIRKRARA